MAVQAHLVHPAVHPLVQREDVGQMVIEDRPADIAAGVAHHQDPDAPDYCRGSNKGE